MNEIKVRPDENTIYSCPDLQTAKLKLAFLKENHEFQKFFSELKLSWQKFKQSPDKSAPLCKELRYDDEDFNQYDLRIHAMRVEGTPFWGGMGHIFNLYEHAIFLIQRDGLCSTDEFLEMMNPENKDFEYYNDSWNRALPKLFMSSSVSEFGLCNGLDESPDGKLQYRRYQYEISTSDLKPAERIIKIDLKKNIGQIKKELEFFIQKERKTQKINEDLSARLKTENSEHTISITWTVKDKRNQIDVLEKQLEVWLLRDKGWKFNEIAIKHGETEDTTKKRFYNAFLEITGTPYSKKMWGNLLKQKLEKLIKDNTIDSHEKKIIYTNYQKATEPHRKELLFNDLGDGDSDFLGSFHNEDFQPNQESILTDFLKICQKCHDLDCRKSFISAIKNKEYENIPPCPRLYKFLKD